VRTLAILGGGSWGTALAIALSSRFEEIRLWAREASRAAEMQRLRQNQRYLPGFQLPAQTFVSHSLQVVLKRAEVVLCVVPSAHLRAVLECARPHLYDSASIVSATKGLEERSLYRMSEVIGEVLGDRPISVLSGPTFAKEIAAGEPAAVVIGSQSPANAERIQTAFATRALRLYTSPDVVGIEIGAALKNVIALGAGVCRGLGLGSNSVAALITRGLAEITRLAVALGGSPRTLSGLAGLGDLVLTATGDLSRNRHVGIQLGQGQKLDQIVANMNMVAEGVTTSRAAHQLGIACGIELPITDKVYEILYAVKDPRVAIRELMDRPLTNE
jgi:glycerol-3-phosphate dehydrogenase (NAD(P)+)